MSDSFDLSVFFKNETISQDQRDHLNKQIKTRYEYLPPFNCNVVVHPAPEKKDDIDPEIHFAFEITDYDTKTLINDIQYSSDIIDLNTIQYFARRRPTRTGATFVFKRGAYVLATINLTTISGETVKHVIAAELLPELLFKLLHRSGIIWSSVIEFIDTGELIGWSMLI